MTDKVQPHGSQARDGILGSLASDLAASRDLPELLSRFLEPLICMAGADAGAVRAISDDGDQLQLVSSVGLPEPALLAEGSLHRPCGACGQAAAGETPVWASELSPCARLVAADPSGATFRRMVAVPLRHHGKVLGTYSLFFLRDQSPAAEVLAVLKSVGELLGLALNNARLEREHLRATVLHERQMMAAEVHDSIAQTLAFVRMRLPLIEAAVGAHDDVHTTRYLGELRGAVGEAHASLRAIINDLRAPPDPLGLTHALRDRVGQLRARHGLDAELIDHAPGLALPGAEESQVLQIVSEALANIVHHARASHAWLSVTQQDGRVEVRVEDDGCGLDANVRAAGAAAGHHGIEIMRERARCIGGELEIRPRQGVGTMLQLNFPLPRAAAN